MLTSVQDEVLAHRLGLIPLDANPAVFEYKTSKLVSAMLCGDAAEICVAITHALLTMLMFCAGEETASEKNTFVLRLKVMCTRQGAQMVNDRGRHYMHGHRHMLCQQYTCFQHHTCPLQFTIPYCQAGAAKAVLRTCKYIMRPLKIICCLRPRFIVHVSASQAQHVVLFCSVCERPEVPAYGQPDA